MKQYQWYKPAPLPAAGEHIVGNYRHLTGACIGDEDYTYRMYRELRGKDFPPNLQGEAHVIDAIWGCRDRNIPPTRENVIQIMTLSGRADIDMVIQMVELCMAEAGWPGEVDRSAVRACSAAINIWLQDQRGLIAAGAIAEIMNRPWASYTDKYDEAVRALTNASPTDTIIEQYTEERLFDAWLLEQRELHRIRKEGGDVGPHLPWLAARAFISRFGWGQFTTLMGREGSGKTSVLLDIAEYIAWKQKLNCDFVNISCETDLLTIQRRWFSKKSLISFKSLDEGEIDLDSPKWMPKINEFQALRNKNSETRGHIHFIWMPDARVEQVTMMMERCARASAAQGRRVCFGIDYLQKMNWWDYNMPQNQAYEMIGEKLASANRKLMAHTFLMAQEGGTEGEAFGSKVIRKISQLVLTIRRTEFEGRAAADGPFVLGPDGKTPLKDALGRERRFYYKDDQWDSVADIAISKANNAPTRFIKLHLEGAYNLIHEDAKQIEQLRKSQLLPPIGK
jgi:hypothetical protein